MLTMQQTAAIIRDEGIPTGEIAERDFQTDGDIELWPQDAERDYVIHLQEVRCGRFEIVTIVDQGDGFIFQNVELPLRDALKLALHVRLQGMN